MLGGIVGDIIGSFYEWDRIKTKDFPLFSNGSKYTDDSILTCATAKVLLDGGSYADTYADFGTRYTRGGYGARFASWLKQWDRKPYNSFGNGSAMRVGPVGWAFGDPDTIVVEAKRSAECTHNHPEGIKGAQATALAIFHARSEATKEDIRAAIESQFGYDLSRSCEEIRPNYDFDVTCQGTVPQAIISFLESTDYEDAIRNAVSLGGDSDTLACITGSIAEAFYGGVPKEIEAEAMRILSEEFVEIVTRFRHKYA